MSRGGARPGAGRPSGSPNKATEQLRALAVELVGDGDSPLDFLTSVYRDDSQPIDLRVEAAGKAAPYVHPKLATVTVKGDDENPLKTVNEVRIIAVEPEPRDE